MKVYWKALGKASFTEVCEWLTTIVVGSVIIWILAIHALAVFPGVALQHEEDSSSSNSLVY